jgi:putative component of membrane protein insertase Oxa1/YidC/SpoIIIJ protein YidD
MRRLFLLAIKSYWRLVPPRRRRQCVFRESCSRHVYRIVRDEGAIRGMIAFARRLRRCRHGYSVVLDEQLTPSFLLADGSTLPDSQASDFVLQMLQESAGVVKRIHQLA